MSKMKDIERKKSNGTFLFSTSTRSNSSHDMGGQVKYCQGPKCHTYDTTDRKRGPKGNKRNQTRSISTYSYGNGNFCTLNCQNDWWEIHGTRAVDQFGRIHGPIVLAEENAWRRTYNYDWYDNQDQPRYHEINTVTQEQRPCEQPE